MTVTPGGVESRTIKTHETDAAGQIELSFTHDDPDGDTAGNRVQLVLALVLTVDGDARLRCPLRISTTTSSLLLTALRTTPDNGVDNLGVIWSDAASRATTITLGQAVNYHETNANGVRNTVTATLVDQYGDPVRGVKVGPLVRRGQYGCDLYCEPTAQIFRGSAVVRQWRSGLSNRLSG